MIVVVPIVADTITATAVSAQILRGIGKFFVQNVFAGAYHLSAEAAREMRPLQVVVAAGQHTTARLVAVRLASTVKLVENCILE